MNTFGGEGITEIKSPKDSNKVEIKDGDSVVTIEDIRITESLDSEDVVGTIPKGTQFANVELFDDLRIIVRNYIHPTTGNEHPEIVLPSRLVKVI